MSERFSTQAIMEAMLEKDLIIFACTTDASRGRPYRSEFSLETPDAAYKPIAVISPDEVAAAQAKINQRDEERIRERACTAGGFAHYVKGILAQIERTLKHPSRGQESCMTDTSTLPLNGNSNETLDVPAHDNHVHVNSEMFTGRVYIDGVDAVARIKMLERVVRNLLGLCDQYGAPNDFINEALYGCDDNGDPIPNTYLASLDPVTDWSLCDETS